MVSWGGVVGFTWVLGGFGLTFSGVGVYNGVIRLKDKESPRW